MAFYGGQYGQYTLPATSGYNNPQVQQQQQQMSAANYLPQFGNFNTSSGAAPVASSASVGTTPSSNTSTSSTPFGFQQTSSASSTPAHTTSQSFPSQSFYGYSNSSTSSVTAPLQGFQNNFSSLWYNQTSNTASTGQPTTQQQSQNVTRPQQMTAQQLAAYQQYMQHAYIQQQQQQYQQQQQQLSNSAASNPSQQQQAFKSPVGAKTQTSNNTTTAQSLPPTGWGNPAIPANSQQPSYSNNPAFQNHQQMDAGRSVGWGSTPPIQAQSKDWAPQQQQQQQQQQTNTYQQQQAPHHPTQTQQQNTAARPNFYGNASGDYNWPPQAPLAQQQSTIQRQPQIYPRPQTPKNQNYPVMAGQQYGNNMPRGGNVQGNQAYRDRPDQGTFPQDARASWGTRGTQQNNWGDNQGWGDWSGQRNQQRPSKGEGPNIPPFPEAWQMGGLPPSGQNGNWDPANGPNWTQGGWQQQQQQQQQPQQQGFDQNGRMNNANRFQRGDNQQRFPNNGRYSPNSRQSRGEKTERELWSPAENKKKFAVKPPMRPQEGLKEVETERVIQPTEIKAFLYSWLGAKNLKPVYNIHDKPDQSYRCELTVGGHQFVGVGDSQKKKEAQTEAAWNFADFLVKQGEVKESELPPKSKIQEDMAENFGAVKETNIEKKEENNLYKKAPRPQPQPQPHQQHHQQHQQQHQHQQHQRRPPSANNMNHMRGAKNNIPPLMSLVTAPVGVPPMPPFMEYGFMPQEMWRMPPPHLQRGGPWMEGPPGPWHGGMMGPGPRGPGRWHPDQHEYWRQRELEEQWMEEIHQSQEFQNPEDIFINRMIMRQKEATMGPGMRGRPHHPMPPMMEGRPGEWQVVQPAKNRNQLTLDDRHIMSKHAAIYPHEEELKSVHRLVTVAEQALKSLSDQFVDEDHPLPKSDEEEDVEEEKSEKNKNAEDADTNEEKGSGDDDKAEKKAKIQILKRPKKPAKKLIDTRPRVLCAVNRVGTLAKGLLIHQDPNVCLVLLCGEIPTKPLLERVMEYLPAKLREADESLDFKLTEHEAGFSIIAQLDVQVTVTVSLTSTALNKSKQKESKQESKEIKETKESKDKEEAKDGESEETEQVDKKETKDAEPASAAPPAEELPEGMLPKPLLLAALAQLRHAKWFQARASQQDCCIVMIRILRDLKLREKTWAPLSNWAIENLVYISLSSSTEHMGHGDAFRRVFEVLAGGIMLPDRPGVQDPCEKEKVDVLDCCTDQQLEEITRFSQHVLLKIAFRQIHQVLGMDKLSPPSIPRPGVLSSSSHHPPPSQDHEDPNLRKRRLEENSEENVAESPKRSLTDEEDADTQQNLAELRISENTGDDINSEEVESAPEKSTETIPKTAEETNQEPSNLPEQLEIETSAEQTESIEITAPEDANTTPEATDEMTSSSSS